MARVRSFEAAIEAGSSQSTLCWSFMRWISQFFGSRPPWPPVRTRATRRDSPRPPDGWPWSVAMTSSSRHFSRSYSPKSQMVTVPPPYSSFGMVPSNVPYSSGWSSVITARWLRPVSVGTPFGSAHDTSTPSCSRRKSQCSREAWCSWMTNDLPPDPSGAGGVAGTGSGVLLASRFDRYTVSRSRAPPECESDRDSCDFGDPADSGCASCWSSTARSECHTPPGASTEPGDSALSASGSARLRIRVSTSSSSSCSSCFDASSRQVRGTATVGRKRPRSEYGQMVVLLPLFWLQSTSTLPVRSAFFMSLTTRSGWSASSARAGSWATLDTSSEVWRPSSAA